jgi:hypothetical protein
MKTKLEGSQRFKHAENLAWRRIKGEAVILDLDTSEYFSLNETGVLIWERLGVGECLDEVREALCREYTVAEEKARTDVFNLTQQLLDRKFLGAR